MPRFVVVNNALLISVKRPQGEFWLWSLHGAVIQSV